MTHRPLCRVFAIAALVILAGCKKQPPEPESTHTATSVAVANGSSSPAAAGAEVHVIQSKDEVCNLLTSAEVSEELKKAVSSGRQLTKNLDVPRECAYPTGDGPDALAVSVRLTFQPPDVAVGFAHAIFEVCGHDKQERIQSLGDEAVFCSKLLVRKGDAFFVLSRLNGEAMASWRDSAQRLASKIVARLP